MASVRTVKTKKFLLHSADCLFLSVLPVLHIGKPSFHKKNGTQENIRLWCYQRNIPYILSTHNQTAIFLCFSSTTRDGKPVNFSGLPDSFSTEDRCLFFYCHLFNQFLLFHNCFPSHFHPYSAFFLFLYPLITSTSIPAMKRAITVSIPIPAFFQFSIPVSSCSPS